MDLFGRKAKAQVASFDIERNTLLRKIGDLENIIREMDQEIYNMSMKTDWPSMRAYFNNLQHGMEERKRHESQVINRVIHSELLGNYAR